MKKIINILYLLPILLLGSCNDFLEKSPDSRLRLDSYDKISELLVRAYPDGTTIFLEFMTDNVGPDPQNDEFRPFTSAYKWRTTEEEFQDTPSYYWSRAYNAIAHANQALEALELVGRGDINRYKAVKAEALACRAYAHFMLVNIFAKHYDKATAASDLGVVYMTKPEVTLLEKYERESVQKCYDLIEADLKVALSDVSNTYYKNSGKYHFTKEAVYAFASRFYLYKGDYENCIKYSTMLLGESYNDRYVRNYQTVFSGTNSEVMGRNFTSTSLDANLLVQRKETYYGYRAYMGYRLTEGVYSTMVLSNDDQRFKLMYSYNQSSYFAPKFERTLLFRESLTATNGMPYIIIPTFRAEETLFNLCESLLMSERASEAEDILDGYILKMYNNKANFGGLFNYYKKTYPDLSDEQLMLHTILEEKRREFHEESLRWFDIKRHKMVVQHKDNMGVSDVLTADDYRKVLQIPASALDFGGLKPNPSEQIPTPKRVILTIK